SPASAPACVESSRRPRWTRCSPSTTRSNPPSPPDRRTCLPVACERGHPHHPSLTASLTNWEARDAGVDGLGGEESAPRCGALFVRLLLRRRLLLTDNDVSFSSWRRPGIP